MPQASGFVVKRYAIIWYALTYGESMVQLIKAAPHRIRKSFIVTEKGVQ